MWAIFVSIITGGVAGAIVARLMIDSFFKKLEVADEELREEMVEIVIQTIKENAFRPKPECMGSDEL